MSVLATMLKKSHWLSTKFQEELERIGLHLTRTEHFVIANIAAGECRASRIARNLGISRQAVSQILAGLVSRGFVTTRQDPNNGRVRILEISGGAGGQGICVAALKRFDEDIKQIVGADDFECFCRVLNTDWQLRSEDEP
ncbi:MAG TPA: MarR family transcriptional regulator [Allosphingosinicella sp.]|nr:MarR family transcriptional regulator [Allosphingosinicella sp.]